MNAFSSCVALCVLVSGLGSPSEPRCIVSVDTSGSLGETTTCVCAIAMLLSATTQTQHILYFIENICNKASKTLLNRKISHKTYKFKSFSPSLGGTRVTVCATVNCHSATPNLQLEMQNRPKITNPTHVLISL